MEPKNAAVKPIDRHLSRVDVFAMAIGVMVGWGAFVMPGTTFLPIAGPAGTWIALSIGAVITLVIGENFAFLMRHNLINMEIAQMILTQMGFSVETAENGQLAVERLKAVGPGYFDLILMDIQMPVMDGYTATRIIRSMPDPVLKRIPIVAMTANAFAEDVQAALDAGMQAHIAKPVDIAVLNRTLREVLRGQTTAGHPEA